MRTAIATLRTALADGRANRASFILQIVFMGLNDVTWIVFWALFFNRVGPARGWTLDDIVVMFSLLTVVAGFGIGLFANCRRIGRLAADGALDEILVLPVSPLGHLLSRRVEAANLGDIIFGVMLFAFLGHPTPERCVVFVVTALLGVVVLTGFLVLVGAISMLTDGGREQEEMGFGALLIFASYPLDFFGGPLRILLFSLVPAAFITGVPVALMRHFEWAPLVGMGVAAVVTATLAWVVFTLGLRRYSSGSLWQR